MAQPMPTETIIQNAKKHDYVPVRYPTGELLLTLCPKCNTPGSVIFRHQTDESTVDIYACAAAIGNWVINQHMPFSDASHSLLKTKHLTRP